MEGWNWCSDRVVLSDTGRVHALNRPRMRAVWHRAQQWHIKMHVWGKGDAI